MPNPVLLLAAHARVAIATARKAILLGPAAIGVRRAREDIIDAAERLGIKLGVGVGGRPARGISCGIVYGEGPGSVPGAGGILTRGAR